MKIMKIIIIGGDGFVGWPLALRLSNKNYEILRIRGYQASFEMKHSLFKLINFNDHFPLYS